MNLYLVSQGVNNDYDTYDAFVCVAQSAKEAKHMKPSDWGGISVWAPIKDVKVSLIGLASPRFKASEVVLTSFKAG